MSETKKVIYSTTYNQMVVNIKDNYNKRTIGFTIKAKDEEAFNKDPEGWTSLTNFLIELEALDFAFVNALLRKYKITIYNKPDPTPTPESE